MDAAFWMKLSVTLFVVLILVIIIAVSILEYAVRALKKINARITTSEVAAHDEIKCLKHDNCNMLRSKVCSGGCCRYHCDLYCECETNPPHDHMIKQAFERAGMKDG